MTFWSVVLDVLGPLAMVAIGHGHTFRHHPTRWLGYGFMAGVYLTARAVSVEPPDWSIAYRAGVAFLWLGLPYIAGRALGRWRAMNPTWANDPEETK